MGLVLSERDRRLEEILDNLDYERVVQSGQKRSARCDMEGDEKSNRELICDYYFCRLMPLGITYDDDNENGPSDWLTGPGV